MLENLLNYAGATATSVGGLISDATTSLTSDFWDYSGYIFGFAVVLLGAFVAWKILKRFTR